VCDGSRSESSHTATLTARRLCQDVGSRFFATFVQRVTTQIPDDCRHLIRYDGASSHRSRGARRAREEAEAEATAAGMPSVEAGADESPPTRSRASWARLLRRIYEASRRVCMRAIHRRREG